MFFFNYFNESIVSKNFMEDFKKNLKDEEFGTIVLLQNERNEELLEILKEIKEFSRKEVDKLF